jgi:uncharacterized NAD(P)/FAD-binding protein YdhS
VLQVGCGPGGASLARRLLTGARAAGTPLSLTIVDRGALGFGTGFATPVATHLLNTPADGTSLLAEDEGEFVRWRAARRAWWRPQLAAGDDDAEAAFPPRRLFGLYVADVLATAIETARGAGLTITTRSDEVVRVRRARAGGFEVLSAAAGEERFDVVLLALGHSAVQKVDPQLAGEHYHENPWATRTIAADACVAVLGTRLSAIDTALALAADGHRGPIVLASRSGALPRVKGPVAPHRLQHVPQFVAEGCATVTLAEVATVVAAEIDLTRTVYRSWAEAMPAPPTTTAGLRAEIALAASGAHAHWQSVLAALVPWIPDLWRRLDADGQQALSTTYRTPWMTRVASFPLVSAQRILALLESGQLRIHGALEAVQPEGAGYRLAFADGRPPIHADAVVNATGPGFGARALEALPLTRELLADGLASAHPGGGLRVDAGSFALLAPDGTPQEGLHLIGDLSRSVWGATNTVVGMARQARILADHVIARVPIAATGKGS